MNRAELLKLSATELSAACTCTEAAQDGEEPACEACFIAGALSAGIPRSVIAGETRLSDHFSAEYINHQCNREQSDETAD